MKFKIIACINNNNVLGRDNDLLYTIKNDLANFKRITNGGVVIMGKNLESVILKGIDLGYINFNKERIKTKIK